MRIDRQDMENESAIRRLAAALNVPVLKRGGLKAMRALLARMASPGRFATDKAAYEHYDANHRSGELWSSRLRALQRDCDVLSHVYDDVGEAAVVPVAGGGAAAAVPPQPVPLARQIYCRNRRATARSN
jgi:hypothetical protein